MDDAQRAELTRQISAIAGRKHVRRPNATFARCAVCGTWFAATRRDARYCSDAHRQKAHRQRHRT